MTDLVARAALGDSAQAATAQRTRDDDAPEPAPPERGLLGARVDDEQIVDHAHVESPPRGRLDTADSTDPPVEARLRPEPLLSRSPTLAAPESSDGLGNNFVRAVDDALDRASASRGLTRIQPVHARDARAAPRPPERGAFHGRGERGACRVANATPSNSRIPSSGTVRSVPPPRGWTTAPGGSAAAGGASLGAALRSGEDSRSPLTSMRSLLRRSGRCGLAAAERHRRQRRAAEAVSRELHRRSGRRRRAASSAPAIPQPTQPPQPATLDPAHPLRAQVERAPHRARVCARVETRPPSAARAPAVRAPAGRRGRPR